MNAREEILGRVRAALRDVPPGDETAVPRAYARTGAAGAVSRFAERVADYGATVVEVDRAGIQDAAARRLAAHAVGTVAVPDDLPLHWVPLGVRAVAESALDVEGLDAVGAAMTGCVLGIADTGTILLDCGARQGGRRLTLLPDYHLCVVEAERVVASVPEATPTLAAALRARRPVTLVSGPSATADIELERVDGVHGPRRLDVLLVRA